MGDIGVICLIFDGFLALLVGYSHVSQKNIPVHEISVAVSRRDCWPTRNFVRTSL